MSLGDHPRLGLAVIAVTHGYLWFRLVFGVTRSRFARGLGAIAFIVLAMAVYHTLVLSITDIPRYDRAITESAFPWMGVWLLLLCSTALTEIPRFAFVVSSRLRGHPVSAARRRLLGQIAGLTAAATGAGTSVLGALSVLDLHVVRVRVPLRSLPRAMNGTKIVQVSDLHLGGGTGSDYLTHVIAETNALDPDLIVITGDLVDGFVHELSALLESLRDLRARHGVYFVTGNHEYYYGGEDWVQHLASLGIRVLRNERVSIGTKEASFDLAGVDDRTADAYGIGHGENLAKALAGRDRERALVLLAHQPKTIFNAERHGVDLQLSGHTHGGQIFPYGLAVYLDQPFIAGLHQVGETRIYVSRGTGYWGPPMRVGARPEITEITLVSQA